ncbi:uncharacterized protein LOC134832629 [Culicoides brevitarsis]|uniref:uncharacterized protein LOC134832629 n=1 Tax=Culicoides brevitarsis TaxID=469753 RepID=UPI00307B4BC0
MTNKKTTKIGLFYVIMLIVLASIVDNVNAQTKYSFDIKSLTGEPDYRSVNLTWEVEDFENEVDGGSAEEIPLSAEDEDQIPSNNRSFTVYYCELQTWGAHRCKSKVLEDTEEREGNTKQYSMMIDHLRMATKYSFHVKASGQNQDQKPSARADLNGNILKDDSEIQGQTIIIPTKGFSAHATKCLPDVSEIEVETGPYFGGKIVAENNNCFTQGNPLDDRSSYSMKIEHDKCGSHVNHETLTVETFITVQENLGILTHSTRRFMVVCTFQPDTLTVRARLALPGKGGVEPISDYWPEQGRSARERQFKMVNKTALILKESDEIPENLTEEVHEGIGDMEELTTTIEPENEAENLVPDETFRQKTSDRGARFARLLDERQQVLESSYSNYARRAAPDFTGILLTICVACIMIGAFVFIVQREARRFKRETSPGAITKP